MLITKSHLDHILTSIPAIRVQYYGSFAPMTAKEFAELMAKYPELYPNDDKLSYSYKVTSGQIPTIRFV